MFNTGGVPGSVCIVYASVFLNSRKGLRATFALSDTGLVSALHSHMSDLQPKGDLIVPPPPPLPPARPDSSLALGLLHAVEHVPSLSLSLDVSVPASPPPPPPVPASLYCSSYPSPLSFYAVCFMIAERFIEYNRVEAACLHTVLWNLRAVI